MFLDGYNCKAANVTGKSKNCNFLDKKDFPST